MNAIFLVVLVCSNGQTCIYNWLQKDFFFLNILPSSDFIREHQFYCSCLILLCCRKYKKKKILLLPAIDASYSDWFGLDFHFSEHAGNKRFKIVIIKNRSNVTLNSEELLVNLLMYMCISVRANPRVCFACSLSDSAWEDVWSRGSDASTGSVLRASQL